MKKKAPYFKQKKQQRHISVLVVFIGACVFLYSLLFPLYRPTDYLICLGLTFLATLVLHLFLSGAFAPSKAPQQPLWAKPTGNSAMDEFMENAQVLLTDLTLEKERINDREISEKTDELLVLCRHIFSTVSQQPEKLPQIRKFMNYYLPTTADLLHKYRSFITQQKDERLIAQTRTQLLQALHFIVPACEKQLRALYQNEVLDMQVDIQVLEKMLKKDGFIPSELHMDHHQ